MHFFQIVSGIMYYIDTNSNVYAAEDVVGNKLNPRIIARYACLLGVYSIASFVWSIVGCAWWGRSMARCVKINKSYIFLWVGNQGNKVALRLAPTTPPFEVCRMYCRKYCRMSRKSCVRSRADGVWEVGQMVCEKSGRWCADGGRKSGRWWSEVGQMVCEKSGRWRTDVV